MRALLTVDPARPADVFAALRERWERDGPAVFPATVGDAPAHVDDDIALVIQTSGSSGRPKRVALSETALRASAQATHDALGGPGRWLVCLSPAFVAGAQQFVRSIVAGTSPVLGPIGSFDPAAFADAATQTAGERTYSALVPAQLGRLVRSGETDDAVRAAVAGIDALIIGGQALPAAVAERAHGLGYRIVRTYGSSETATGCVYDGRPIGDTRLRVVDGVLEIAGSTLADGYLEDPDATAAAFHVEDGVRWYRTGDRALLADGRVQVLGRADDMLISGGVKVPVGRVEAVVRELPGFADAVVVAAPSETWGQVPVVMMAEPAASLALADVRSHVGSVLGPAARPDRIVTLPALPTTATGKPDRRALALLLGS